MKSIYILLSKSDTYVSKMIKIVTSDYYTHSSIAFDASLEPLYSFARRFSYSPLPAGIRHESLCDGYFKKHSDIPCALFELPVEDEVYETAKQYVQCMMEESSKYRYNVMGLFLCKFNIAYSRENRYFCSEFIGEVLEKSNALKFNKSPSLLHPVDFAAHPELIPLFEGNIAELVQYINCNTASPVYGRSVQII